MTDESYLPPASSQQPAVPSGDFGIAPDSPAVEERRVASGSRERLAARVRELGGTLGATADFEDTPGPRDYFRRLLAWETAPLITHREWLARHGLAFRPPNELPPAVLGTELWRMIHALAFGRVFLYGTDHLGDAELYDRLWREVLGAEEPDVPRHSSEAFHWDLSLPEDGGEETWLMYYATEQERADWAADFPGSPIPLHRPCQHPREHLLPKRE